MSDEDVARRIGGLSTDQRALLEKALLARRRERMAGIRPREGSGPAPLSASQHRLWFFDQIEPGTLAYNAVVAFWVTGHLDLDALDSAVRASIQRHEVLRSAIRQTGDEPAQVALDTWEFAVAVVECDTREAAQEVVVAAARQRFDLAADVTLRVAVAKVGETSALVGFLEHHIAFDGWSDQVLFREVSAAYAAAIGGDAVDRPPLPVQYADYAVWQREALRGPALERLRRYWSNTLSGAKHVIDLPFDRARPERQAFDGEHLSLGWGAELARAVRSIAREANATTYMVLVAGVIATLYRWTGETDITVGTPAANRHHVEVEDLIGFFSNTVPLRVVVPPAEGFTALLDVVRSTALDAFDHQELPFEQIVDAVGPERDPRVNPLFQVNVRAQSGALPRPTLPGAEVTPVHLDLGYSRFDLAVEFQVGEEGIGGYIEFNRGLFDRTTIQAFGELLETVTRSALAEPAKPLWELPPDGAGRTRRRAARRG